MTGKPHIHKVWRVIYGIQPGWWAWECSDGVCRGHGYTPKYAYYSWLLYKAAFDKCGIVKDEAIANGVVLW